MRPSVGTLIVMITLSVALAKLESSSLVIAPKIGSLELGRSSHTRNITQLQPYTCEWGGRRYPNTSEICVGGNKLICYVSEWKRVGAC